jgi:hypothetical protein
MIQIKALYREEFQLAFSSSVGRRPPDVQKCRNAGCVSPNLQRGRRPDRAILDQWTDRVYRSRLYPRLGRLGVLRINIGGEGLRLLAELTLAMVLFTDAANADFSIVKRNLGLPERLLLIGLPLTILLGFLFAAIVFPSLEALELALLAAMRHQRTRRLPSQS